MGCNCSSAPGGSFCGRGTDPYHDWFKQFPISKMHLNEFKRGLLTYEARGMISIDELNREFMRFGKGWQELQMRGSDLIRVLNCLPNSDGSRINVTTLLCLGILLCRGTDADRSDCIVDMLLIEGGPESTEVSVDDPKLEQILSTIVELAVVFFVEQFYYLTIEIPGYNKKLQQRAVKAIRISEITYPFEHCGLIHRIFEYKQTVSFAEFKERLESEKCNWLFDDRELRQRTNDYFLDEFLLE
jgi:hypothetical protein